ncbi:uncharacterized protein [Littorina saxatilis]|uniref:uncharacterized protein n=1 Tax=Littorina saxatilis TaxID=31220 RepID=UPI0038B4E282
MHNETLIIDIDEREGQTNFRVTLHMSDIRNFDCAWPVKEPLSTYPTGQTAPDATMSPAPKDKRETNESADHKVAIGLGVTTTILVIVLAGIVVYKFRESIGTGFRNFRCDLYGMRCERSRDLEQGLPGTSAGSIGANNTFVNGHVRKASSISALPPLQNGAAEQLAHDVEADGKTTPATERNGTDIPQDIDQNIEDSGQACGTEDNDLERAHTSAQSPESMPLLTKAVIENEPSGASTGLQDDRDQLMTDDAEVCTAAMPDIATTGSYVSGDDEGSPEDDFEQFDDKDLEEAKQNDTCTTETLHNETQTETGFMYKLRSFSVFGSNTAKQPEHAPVGT